MRPCPNIPDRGVHRGRATGLPRGRETCAERGASPNASDLCWSNLLPKNSLALEIDDQSYEASEHGLLGQPAVVAAVFFRQRRDRVIVTPGAATLRQVPRRSGRSSSSTMAAAQPTTSFSPTTRPASLMTYGISPSRCR